MYNFACLFVLGGYIGTHFPNIRIYSTMVVRDINKNYALISSLKIHFLNKRLKISSTMP